MYITKKHIILLVLFVFSASAGFYSCYYWNTYCTQQTSCINTLQRELNLGITYIRYGQQNKYQKNNALQAHSYYNKAHKHFNKALAIEPNCAQAYCYIGITLHEQHDNKNAFDTLQKAIVIDKTYGEPYFHMAKILVEEKEFDQAIFLYKQILAQQPGNDMIREQLNLAYAERSTHLAQQLPLLRNTQKVVV